MHNPDDVAACLRVLARAAERPDDPALAATVRRSGERAALPAATGTDLLAFEALFPSGLRDETGEPLDLRDTNSWVLGSGGPRRMKRAAARVLREPGPAPDDVRAIASVYR